MEVKSEVKNTVEKNKRLIYGLFIGLFLGWTFGGQGGENTGWLMLVSVGVFIYYTMKIRKVVGRTVTSVVTEIGELMRNEGLLLDTRLKYVRVRKLRDGYYLFDFLKNSFTYGWEGKLTGVQDVYDQSSDVLETQFYLRQYEMTKAMREKPKKDED
jgi:hypothetical protein